MIVSGPIMLNSNRQIDIFKFERFQDLLCTYYSLNKKLRARTFTLDRWSADIGYQSPRVLAMVMKGQRAPSFELYEKLSSYFVLKGSRHRYFELLYRKAILEFKKKDISEINHSIQSANPKFLGSETIDYLTFELIYEWYHLVLKQLVTLPGFKNNAELIAKRLKNKLSPTKIIRSLELLQQAKIIAYDSTRKKMKVNTDVRIGNSVPSIAIKKHHEQMLDRAKEALLESPIDQRHFSSVTFCMKMQEIPEAKKMIETFLNEFDERFSSYEGTDVFQMNVQLFSHTEIQSEGAHA